MRMHMVLFCTAAFLVAASLGAAADTPHKQVLRSNSGGVAPGETSDRTPQMHSKTPAQQVNKTAEGETSDRTPANHGEVHQQPVAVTH
jgi:hypothetical protein